jgi:hypothetical protein
MLDQQHAVLAAFRQPIREDAASRTCADDNVVVHIGRGSSREAARSSGLTAAVADNYVKHVSLLLFQKEAKKNDVCIVLITKDAGSGRPA